MNQLRFLVYKSQAQPSGRVGLLNATGTAVTPLSFPSGRPIVRLRDLIAEWDSVSTKLHPGEPVEELAQVDIAAPLPGRDVLAVGKNYFAHAKEFQQSGYDSSDKNEQPDFPVIFTKRASSIVATGTEIYPHPEVTESLDYEGELGVIIGTGGIGIKKADAWKHVWGAVVINDVTARERQRDHKQFYIGKSLDTFCPMGPYAVHSSMIDWKNMILETKVNGDVRQHQNTAELIFDIPTLIETCSMGITLQPGDVIATGTPAGVGIGKSPPVFLKSGDLVEVSITGLGTLKNIIGDASLPPPACAPVDIDLVKEASNPDSSLLHLPSGISLHVETSLTRPGVANGHHAPKPVLVFIHGLGGSSANYDAVHGALQVEDSYDYIKLDLEGHGLSPLSGGNISIARYAASVREVMLELSCSTATVVGHSMGGLIATTFASKYPEMVNRLILLGAVKKFAPGGVEALKGRAGTVRSNGMIAIADTVAKAGTSAKTASSRPLATALVRLSLLTTPAEGYACACEALAGASEPDYSKITSPVLFVTGDEDKTSPAATFEFLSKALVKTKHSEVALKEVGHWMLIEEWEETAKAIGAFL